MWPLIEPGGRGPAVRQTGSSRARISKEVPLRDFKRSPPQRFHRVALCFSPAKKVEPGVERTRTRKARTGGLSDPASARRRARAIRGRQRRDSRGRRFAIAQERFGEDHRLEVNRFGGFSIRLQLSSSGRSGSALNCQKPVWLFATRLVITYIAVSYKCN